GPGFEYGVAPSGVLNVRVPICQPMPNPSPPGVVTASSAVGVQVTHSTIQWWRPGRQSLGEHS
ncbi:hypothetical protein TorRG33x02_256350, partial [Trema orientale]